MIDTNFTLTNAIQLFTLLCAGAGALLGVWWRIELRIRAVEHKADAETRALDEECRHKLRNAEMTLAAKAIELDKDLTTYKLHVAEKYASWEAVKEMGTRFEALSKQVNEMPDQVADRIMKFMALKA